MVLCRRSSRVINLIVVISFLMAIDAAPAKSLKPQSIRECRRVNVSDWMSVSESFKGMELIAFASWCSSCREKIMSTKAAPDRFVFVSVFEEPEQSARAMSRLGLKSPCIYGPDLVSILGIKALPWSRKI